MSRYGRYARIARFRELELRHQGSIIGSLFAFGVAMVEMLRGDTQIALIGFIIHIALDGFALYLFTKPR